MTSNVIENRTQLEPRILKILSTDEGRSQLAALLSEFVDELRILGLQSDARAEKERCTCCICAEQSSEQEQLRAAVRGGGEA